MSFEVAACGCEIEVDLFMDSEYGYGGDLYDVPAVQDIEITKPCTQHGGVDKTD